ncbi:MAG: HyaD/HybD family hydrogenase maturation endopeptidase [Phycisphaerae bacterium]
MRPTLVLGIGNILMRDEGVGARVIEAMRDMELRGDIDLLDGGTCGADLVDEIADRRKVIVIDAMQAGAEPGTVFRLDAEELLEDANAPVSLHEFGLLDTLMMARHLGCSPQQVVVLGVQPERCDCGLELSAKVAKALPRLIRLVLAEANSRSPAIEDSGTSGARTSPSP